MLSMLHLIDLLLTSSFVHALNDHFSRSPSYSFRVCLNALYLLAHLQLAGPTSLSIASTTAVICFVFLFNLAAYLAHAWYFRCVRTVCNFYLAAYLARVVCASPFAGGGVGGRGERGGGGVGLPVPCIIILTTLLPCWLATMAMQLTRPTALFYLIHSRRAANKSKLQPFQKK